MKTRKAQKPDFHSRCNYTLATGGSGEKRKQIPATFRQNPKDGSCLIMESTVH